MKIVYIVDQPRLYGSEKHVLSLILNFSKTNEVSLVALAKGELLDLLKKENISFTIINTGWFPIKNLKSLIYLIKYSNNTIFHGHQPKAIFWGSILSWYYKKIFISTIHSLPQTNARSHTNILKKLATYLFHFTIKNIAELLSSKVIYLSKFSFSKSFFKYKSIIISNWIETIPDSLLLKNVFDPNCIKLISVGSITYNKGHDRVIDALGLLKLKNWELTIVGDGTPEFISYLKQKCVKYKIEKNVRILPYDCDIFKKLGQFDGFILFSRGETFGLVYIEAMIWGLPIIAWNIPIIKEIIPSGNIIINNINDFAEDFNKFYNSLTNYKIISSKNRNFALKHFEKSAIMNKYQKLYNEILSNHYS